MFPKKVPTLRLAYDVIVRLASDTPALDVNAVTNSSVDSFQNNATFELDPASRLIKKPTSTLAKVDSLFNTVIGS